MANQFKGLYSSAIDDYTMALAIDKDHSNAANNLAWIRATCPVRSLRDGKHALELATAKGNDLGTAEILQQACLRPDV